jgi:hypothetical protein
MDTIPRLFAIVKWVEKDLIITHSWLLGPDKPYCQVVLGARPNLMYKKILMINGTFSLSR